MKLVLASKDQLRAGTRQADLVVIASFLDATAQILNGGTAEKELYLLDYALAGAKGFVQRVPWDFDEMRDYLALDYPRAPQSASPSETDERREMVLELIRRVQGA